ncbi:heavy metal translocating P-type ATPase [Brevibacterium jeotgali]|uniref:Cation-transporting P-type ATPase B n=1 Tax=Brevibacterium jeotgali TaxID=1262550 RepID=A0A2H1L6A8_9MICO|nr:Cu+-exporting ATPase [Brevibacterium jeotgali]SMY12447.1 Cu+-exporting ATPase [Brevibacterium jeotgali]
MSTSDMTAADTHSAGPDASTTVDPTPQEDLELLIGGMTCASCAARVEKKLNRVDGVTASVNYATEKANVSAPAGFDPFDLIEVVEATGYTAELSGDDALAEADARAEKELRGLRVRLIAAIVLTVPVVLMAMVPPLQFDYWGWVSLALTAPVFLWSGWPFHVSTAVNLRHRAVTMDTLITVGTSAAFLWSLAALVFGTAGHADMRHGFDVTLDLGGHGGGLADVYFEVVAGVLTFVLLGRFLEKRSKRSAGAALRALLELGAKDVSLLRDGVESRVPVESLRVGDEFVVRPGETIAADGTVLDGRSAVDASMLTGESVPVEVDAGGTVSGGTVNESGRLLVRTDRVGRDTQLARMAQLVEEAQSGKADVQRLADRVSAVFVPIAMAIAVVTFAVWLLLGFGFTAAMTSAVAVLIIACPCALGLATPTALLVGTGRGAQLGILIRGPEVLETARGIDTIVLDKTGTVTTGTMTVAEVVLADAVDPAAFLRLAGALESGSEHPVARAVVDHARATLPESSPLPPVSAFENVRGRGVRGTVDGHEVLAGRALLFDEAGWTVTGELQAAFDAAGPRGRTAMIVGWDGRARGVVLTADTVKESSAQAVARFHAQDLRVVLLTGDNQDVARDVASQTGIDDVVADVLPEDKVDHISRLQVRGRVVAMVGDGVNDAPALASADLGLAMGTGTDAAIEAADVTLVAGDLMAAADAIDLSRRTLRTIRGNLFWAFAYNAAAIPLAALGLLNPMIAGAAMAFSSVFVVTNSLRLRGFTLGGSRRARTAGTPSAEQTVDHRRTDTTDRKEHA